MKLAGWIFLVTGVGGLVVSAITGDSSVLSSALGGITFGCAALSIALRRDR